MFGGPIFDYDVRLQPFITSISHDLSGMFTQCRFLHFCEPLLLDFREFPTTRKDQRSQNKMYVYFNKTLHVTFTKSNIKL